MKLFVYADNLNPVQLKRRAPERKFLFQAYLPDHKIHFCRWSSQWRSGLASVTPSPGERVWGIVLDLTEEDLKLMDEFEHDVPEGAFRHVEATVETEEGSKELVTLHVGIPVGKFRIKDHYLEFVIKGVKHWQLPDECLELWQSLQPR